MQFVIFGGVRCGTEKSQREEDRMVYEHQKEIHELRKEMHEKDSLLDDLTQNNEVQLQVGPCDEYFVTCAHPLFRKLHRVSVEVRSSFSRNTEM